MRYLAKYIIALSVIVMFAVFTLGLTSCSIDEHGADIADAAPGGDKSLGGGKTPVGNVAAAEPDPEPLITPCDPVANEHCEDDNPGGSGPGGGGVGGGTGGGSGSGTPPRSGGGWFCQAPGYRWMARYGQCVYVGMPCNGICDVADQGVCTINTNYICQCSGGTGC